MTDSSLPLHEALGHTASDKRLEVLRRVGHTGSISQAARDVGISYKAAWQAVETLTSLSGWPLVDRSVGGSGGGGARLTAQGVQLLALADELALARAQVLARFANGQAAAQASEPASVLFGAEVSVQADSLLNGQTGQASQSEGDSAGSRATLVPQQGRVLALGVAGLGLRTSMRNQMPCTVVAVQPHGQGTQARVVLASAGGALLASLVTQESADLLGLVPGLGVLVLCKATAVAVERVNAVASSVAESPPTEACVLHGRVTDVSEGSGRQEVALTLAGGHQWVGFAPEVAVAAPSRLAVGDWACARFAPSALVIGLPG